MTAEKGLAAVRALLTQQKGRRSSPLSRTVREKGRLEGDPRARHNEGDPWAWSARRRAARRPQSPHQVPGDVASSRRGPWAAGRRAAWPTPHRGPGTASHRAVAQFQSPDSGL